MLIQFILLDLIVSLKNKPLLKIIIFCIYYIYHQVTSPKETSCYLGCFADGQLRDLTDLLIDSPSVNKQMCTHTCFSKGYLYAGLQLG
jgi:hypothetical protein